MKKPIAALACVASLLFAATAAAQTDNASMRASDPAELPKVFAVQLHVADLDRSEHFYREVFGARITRIHDRERAVHFASGNNIILVQARPRAADAPESVPESAGGFLMEVADLQAVLSRVEAAGGSLNRPVPPPVQAEAPNGQRAQPQDAAAQAIAAGLRAGMIRDPDGVPIEVIQFPSAQ